MNVVVTGSLGFDYIMDFTGRFADRIMPEKIHQLSLSFLVDTLHKQFGGTAGNVAYTLRLLGVIPYVLTSAGRDHQTYFEHFRKHGIDTKYIRVEKDIDTSAYFVMTDRDDNQIGSFFSGAGARNNKLRIASVKVKPKLVLITPTDPTAMKLYVRECKSLKVPYLYDPAFQIGNFSPQELRDGIEHAQILIGNDYEIALIEQKLNITHEDLIGMVPILITTLARKGSIIETRREAIHVKAALADNGSDPTGAGDAYRAGFVAGYLRKFDLAVCGQMGSVAAVYTVEKYGTQTHEFTKKEFIKRYKENYSAVITL